MADDDRTVTLPSGATAVLHGSDSMTNGQRKPLVRMFRKMQRSGVTVPDPSDPDNPEKFIVNLDALEDDDAFELAEVVLTSMVASWSYDYPIPSSDPTVLDRMPARDYDELAMAAVSKFNDDNPSDEVDPTQPSTSP